MLQLKPAKVFGLDTPRLGIRIMIVVENGAGWAEARAGRRRVLGGDAVIGWLAGGAET